MKIYKLRRVKSKSKNLFEDVPCNKCCFNEKGICTKEVGLTDQNGNDCTDENAEGAYFVEIIEKVHKKRRRHRKLPESAIAFILSEEGGKMSTRALGRKFDVTHSIISRIRRKAKEEESKKHN
jgi:hypothetical protein